MSFPSASLAFERKNCKMCDGKNRVCPVAIAGSLDNWFRRWLQNPRKILSSYITEGMTVLDFGCGPGYFTIDIAQMVGESGRVVAADLQEGMLQKLRDKIQGTELEQRITLHKCEEKRIGLSEEFLNEIGSMLKPNGQFFIVEPPFHVSKTAFEETIRKARYAGFKPVQRPKVFLSKTVILKKNQSGKGEI